jgi:ElaB/YqjD/DUF883 family membrane-anchored ribosome-binding protein
MARDLERELDNLSSGVSELRASLGSLFDRLGSATDQAMHSGRRGFDRVTSEAKRGVHTVETEIEERPFIAVLAAFLIGLLIGRLSSR